MCHVIAERGQSGHFKISYPLFLSLLSFSPFVSLFIHTSSSGRLIFCSQHVWVKFSKPPTPLPHYASKKFPLPFSDSKYECNFLCHFFKNCLVAYSACSWNSQCPSIFLLPPVLSSSVRRLSSIPSHIRGWISHNNSPLFSLFLIFFFLLVLITGKTCSKYIIIIIIVHILNIYTHFNITSNMVKYI